ncbi:MAG: Hpt domain-containing protein [Ideonella sp.]|nr:Hpt domain-containing protein [Ideonella sp.]
MDVGDEIRRLLHQFAAGFLRAASPELLQRLDDHEAHEARLSHVAASHAAALVAPTIALGEMRYAVLTDEPKELASHPPESVATLDESSGLASLSDALESLDDLDPVLWPVFAEEAEELLPVLAQELRHWEAAPAERGAPLAAMRALHTFKGGARLAGAMALGELAHRLESAFEQVLVHPPAPAEGLSALALGVDRLDEHFQTLAGRAPAALSVPPSVQAEPELAASSPVSTAVDMDELAKPVSAAAAAAAAVAPMLTTAQAAPDWSRFLGEEALRSPDAAAGQRAEPAAAVGTVRVRVQLLDRMVSHAGEVSAARARIDSELGQMRQGLKELTENLDRLRRQLRDLEIQAETQMASRMEAARAAQQTFDPLEMDRFTRVQELDRALRIRGGGRSTSGSLPVQAYFAAIYSGGRRPAGATGAFGKRPARRPAACTHGGVRHALRAALSRRATSGKGNWQAGAPELMSRQPRKSTVTLGTVWHPPLSDLLQCTLW